LEPEENLKYRGLEVDESSFDSMIDDDLPAYLTIPNFFKSIYGHWITDILPGLFLAKRLLPMLNVKLLHSGPVPEFGREMLEQFELHGDSLVDIAGFDADATLQLISMTPLRDHDYFHDKLLRKHFSAAVYGVPVRAQSPLRSSLIYVSRRNWKDIHPNSRALTNRDEIEEVFRRFGYTIVLPEQYSVAEQIAIFRQARVVSGESGSGLHNSIFMKPGGRVICIQSGRQNHLIQASLCSLFGQSSAYVVGRQENEDWNSNFTVHRSDVEAAIADAAL
jgi:capsular polysaccharide biosynthesis protein